SAQVRCHFSSIAVKSYFMVRGSSWGDKYTAQGESNSVRTLSPPPGERGAHKPCHFPNDLLPRVQFLTPGAHRSCKRLRREVSDLCARTLIVTPIGRSVCR